MFADRLEAGRQLGERLAAYRLPDPLVVGLPRGGVPVAEAVARALHADLDVLVVRKLGAPGNPEFAMGAVGEDGAIVLDHAVRRQLHVSSEQVDMIAEREKSEIERRVQAYRSGSHRLGLAGRNVIIVDDGLATGSTAAAAVRVARHLGAAHITLAVPVGSVEAVDRLNGMADEVICLQTPDPFYAVGQHYRDFGQVEDEEVIRILQAHPRRDHSGREAARGVDEEVVVAFSGIRLPGQLVVPKAAHGIVVFAHGSGSSRLSPRNIAVAKQLQVVGLGTLLFDLLTQNEADERTSVFDIELLADRLVNATTWLRARPEAQRARIGYFGASTGAAAALVAAAQLPDVISAVVSRGGRPDLAGPWLEKVQSPTLLIVGGHDYPVIDLNREAQRQLRCESLLEIVGGATHLFEEPGTLAQAARLAQSWFLSHLT
jgi:putative phosphoribosyl transferase